MEKWPFFDQNHGLTPLEKSQFFDFLNFFFFWFRKAFFRFRILQNTFSWPILPKKKRQKKVIFGPKPWANPFGKISIFRLFELRFFMGQKGFFSFQNIVTHIFLAYNAKKKEMERRPFCDQNPLEKSQFFDFFKLLFLQARKALFRSRISQNTFSLAILPKTKRWKNGHFWTKTMG